jgi:tetratricopeptide (TPR) repeat protein
MAWNVQVSNDEVALLMEAGLIYRDARRFDDAAVVFKGVRALLPKSDVPEIALGTLEFERGNVDLAITHYQAALRINSNSAYAHAHIAEVQVFRRNLEAAREHVRRAVELDPRGEVGRYARSLGEWITMVEGRQR